MTIGTTDLLATIDGKVHYEDVFSPVGGDVIEINEALGEDHSPIGEGDEGWIVKIEVESLAEIDKLLSKDEYEKLCKA
jgi:glycine cleavage system H protein